MLSILRKEPRKDIAGKRLCSAILRVRRYTCVGMRASGGTWQANNLAPLNLQPQSDVHLFVTSSLGD